jgi:glycine/D-amino acid oxidase-like deaminating enzyme
VAIEDGLGALYTPHCARVQPAKLAAGLAQAAERRGAAIYERSPVRSVTPHVVTTSAGSVEARYVVVATEAYTANLPGRHRALLPLNSAMIVTEPLPDALWARLGWQGAETLLDGSHLYTYSQRTVDGRVAIGGRGVPYRFGSRTDREGPVPAETVRELRERLAGHVSGGPRRPGRPRLARRPRCIARLVSPCRSRPPHRSGFRRWATPARESRRQTWPGEPCGT